MVSTFTNNNSFFCLQGCCEIPLRFCVIRHDGLESPFEAG